MLKEKSCGAIVYRIATKGELQILLIRHRNGGHWSFPKGHMEFGESEFETAHREIREETGLSVTLQDGFRQSVVYSPKPNTQKEVIYFLGEAQSAETVLQEEEVSEAVWVNISEAENLVTFENDWKLIGSAKQFMFMREAK